jgi:hypothetical protein
MATITKRFGSGGANVAPGNSAGTPSLATTLRDVADDLTSLRTKFVATLVKLDADAGVTDANYAATQTPAALLTIKG